MLVLTFGRIASICGGGDVAEAANSKEFCRGEFANLCVVVVIGRNANICEMVVEEQSELLFVYALHSAVKQWSI